MDITKPNSSKKLLERSITAVVTIIVLLASAAPLQAEPSSEIAANQAVPQVALPGNPPENSLTGWKIKVGAAALFAPAFTGSKEYQLMALPNVSLAFKELFFASVKEGVGYNLINSNGWRVGPLVKYQFARNEDGGTPFRLGGERSTALAGLGDVKGTVECGAFAEYRDKPLSYKAELRQGINGHNGMIGEASIAYSGVIKHDGPPLIYAFGPRATFANADYINAYFGIDQTQSVNSGLDRYHAGGGLVSFGIAGFMSMPLYGPVAVSLFGGYDRLAHEVADSPLVKKRGTENQCTIGVGVTYTFAL